MFWGVTLESGKRYSQIVESSYHLSMAALEPNSKEARKPNKNVSVMIEHGKTEFLLCTLEYDRVMQVALDLLFVEGEKVSFFLHGEGVVHLTGYVTDNEDKTVALTSDLSDEESECVLSETDDNSCSKLMKLDDENESTGEEWTPEKAESKKRKKFLERRNVQKLKSSEEKKSQKQNKESISAGITESTENAKNKEKLSNKDDDHVSLSSGSDEEMEDLDEDSDGEESDDEESSEDEEEEDSDEESDDDKEKCVSLSPTKKKKSMEEIKALTTVKTLTPNESKKGSNKSPLHNEVSRPSSTTQNISLNKNMETPGSKKKLELFSGRKKSETPIRDKTESSNLQKSKLETPSGNKVDGTPKNVYESATVSTGKKKKKKRSLSEDNTSFTETPKKDTPSMKLQGGTKVTDIKQGNGPQAKKGRFVHVCYVGRLSNGTEFDSARDRPFSFRLGCGEVIKGLDTGIEGMKVGGKRKLVIPPLQGYGSKKVGPIPPNSTLQFEVELKAVS